MPYSTEPSLDDKCHWAEEYSYCVLVKWDDCKIVSDSAEKYIDQAFDKRKDPIAENVKVYPK